MKFSPQCRTKKLGMIYTILGSFCSFLNWEGTDIWPKIRPRKIPVNSPTGWRNSHSILEIKLIIQQEFHGNRVLTQFSFPETHQIPLYMYTTDYTINRGEKIENQCFVSI